MSTRVGIGPGQDADGQQQVHHWISRHVRSPRPPRQLVSPASPGGPGDALLFDAFRSISCSPAQPQLPWLRGGDLLAARPRGLPGGGSGVQGWGAPCAQWPAVWQGLSRAVSRSPPFRSRSASFPVISEAVPGVRGRRPRPRPQAGGGNTEQVHQSSDDGRYGGE